MSESFLERLNRFTPDPGRLDRDALLFAAGRESARPNRSWIALATALAIAQPVFLMLLWPHPAPPAAPPAPAVVYLVAPRDSVAASTIDASECPGLWSARHSLLRSDPEDDPIPVRAVKYVESGPPLRALAPPPPSILN
jgi:hypothetical protein